MKENAKLVLPKIAPFKEGKDDPFVPLKEDDEPKTRSNRKRVSSVRCWLALPCLYPVGSACAFTSAFSRQCVSKCMIRDWPGPIYAEGQSEEPVWEPASHQFIGEAEPDVLGAGRKRCHYSS